MRKNISDCHPSFSLENVQGSSNYKIIKSGSSLDLAYQLGAMTRRDCHVASLLTITIFLFSFNVQAECTPTPDCASIGYTETSCEGASLKCPFDISKMKCMPCDSSYRYTCSGDNITGGEGNTCNGKYASCTCASGFSFENGECKCPASITTTSCSVGTIYYPDGKCSNDYVACLNPVGVVVKDNALVMSWIKSSYIKWASNTSTDVSGIANITSSSTAKTDYAGKANTLAIVATYTSDTTSNNAAIYCNEYAPVGMESSKGQWYLPAAGELYDYVYGNHNTLLNIYTTHLGYSSFSYWFWSSSEKSDIYAWYVYSYNDYVNYNDKNTNNSVSCFLAL